MNPRMLRRLTIATFVAALLPSVAFAGAVAAPIADASGVGEETLQASEVETRLYPVHHVSLSSAYQLATTVCEEIPLDSRGVERCEVSLMERENYLVVTTTPPIHERISSMLAEVDKPPLTQTFHIVVLGASAGEEVAIDLPEGAQQALEDVRSFLPFTSYRVLDSGWLKTSGRAQANLTGPNGFMVDLRFRGAPDSSRPLMIDNFELGVEVPATMTPGGYQEASYRSILETSFGISVGETVVVGTSKLNGGDEALVVLLTAVQQ